MCRSPRPSQQMRAGRPWNLIAVARQVEPLVQVAVAGEERLDLFVRPVDVLGIARERHPPERSLAAAEERSDIRRHEPREVECVLHSDVVRLLPDVVAVVDAGDAHRLEPEDGPNVIGNRLARGGRHFIGIALAERLPFFDRPPLGKIAGPRVMRGRLIGHQRRALAAALCALQNLRQELGRVAGKSDRHRALLLAGTPDHGERLVERARTLIQITGAQPHLDARGLTFDREHRRARHRRRQRLRAAHAAQPRSQDPFPRPVAAVVLAASLDEGLVGPLDDTLAADVDPRAGGHLAVHHQSLAVELVEVLPGRPFRDEVRVGDQHPRRIRVGPENADRFTRLHEERLVAFEPRERFDDAIEAIPVARSAADAPVDDELFGPLGDFRIEVVLKQAERGFGEPAFRGQLRAARGPDRPRSGHACPHTRLAVSSMTSSLRHCSSGLSRLPAIPDAKPHCGLIASCSSGR